MPAVGGSLVPFGLWRCPGWTLHWTCRAVKVPRWQRDGDPVASLTGASANFRRSHDPFGIRPRDKASGFGRPTAAGTSGRANADLCPLGLRDRRGIHSTRSRALPSDARSCPTSRTTPGQRPSCSGTRANHALRRGSAALEETPATATAQPPPQDYRTRTPEQSWLTSPSPLRST